MQEQVRMATTESRRPEWVFSTAFVLTMCAFLAWLLWFTLTRTSAMY